MIRKIIIRYQVASYCGEDTIYIDDENMCTESILKKFWSRFIRKYGPLPMGYRSAKIIKTVWEQEQ